MADEQQTGYQQFPVFPAYPVGEPPRRNGTAGKAIAAILGFALIAGVVAYVVANQGPTQSAAQSAARNAVNCDETQLASCLIKTPATLVASTSDWGQDTTPDLQQYADELYTTSAGQQNEVNLLTTAGLQTMAHADWVTGPDSDGPSMDLVLMRFATAKGAQSWALVSEGAYSGPEESNGAAVSVPGLPGQAYPAPGPETDITETRYAAAVGNLLMVVRFYSTGGFDQNDFAAWAGAEYLSLKTAKTPPASPVMIDASTTSCGSGLSACLMAPPSGSSPWTDTWGRDTTPSVTAFVAQMYAASDAGFATARLTDQQVSGIAHEAWFAANGDQADLVVLGFRTTQGAESRTREEIDSLSGTRFTVSGPGSAGATIFTGVDSLGFHRSYVYGYVGDVAVELHGYTKGADGQAEVTAWARTELAKLAAAVKPASVVATLPPIPAAPAVSPAACSDALSCLIPAPAGSTPWTNTDYDKDPSPSFAQYVAYIRSSDSAAQQAYQVQILSQYGAQSIAHRAWTAPDGDENDMVVITFANANDARANTIDIQGADYAGGQVFSVPGFPGAIGVEHPMAATGDVQTEFIGYVGRYEVRMYYWSPATFAPADAMAWFAAQVANLRH